MVHIRTVKTFSGEKKYAVVDKFKSITQDKEGNIVTKEEFLPVDYKVGKRVESAVFPYTEEGLKKAKEIQKIFNKK